MSDLLSYPFYDTFSEGETNPPESEEDEMFCEVCDDFIGNLEEHEILVRRLCSFCETQREEKEFEERYERVKREFGEVVAERLESP